MEIESLEIVDVENELDLDIDVLKSELIDFITKSNDTRLIAQLSFLSKPKVVVDRNWENAKSLEESKAYVIKRLREKWDK